MRIVLFLALLFTAFFAQGQRERDSLAGNWILTAQGHDFTLGTTKSNAFGGGAEWFLGEKCSIRGGLAFSDTYFRISTGPLGIFLLTKVKGGNNNNAKQFLAAALCLAILIINTDGITWHIPICKGVYFTPFIAPMQTVVYYNPANKNALKFYSSLGAGISFINKSVFTFNVNAEYTRGFMLTTSEWGYRFMAAVGFRIKSKF